LLSLHQPFYLIDDAKLRQNKTRTKHFCKLFAHTALILDVYQRMWDFIDKGQFELII